MTHNSIAERVGGVARNQDIARWTTAIDSFFISGQEQYFYLSSEEKQQEFIDLIGHSEITSDQILYWHYEATAYEPREESGDSYHFKGRRTIPSIQQALGDIGMNLEFPNDFKVHLAISLDSELAIIYAFKSNAAPVVCRECQASTDPEVREEIDLNPNYSCSHCVEEYSFSHDALLVYRDDIVAKVGEVAQF